MDEKGKEKIAAFDRLLTNDHMRMMKIFLPCLPPKQQSVLAVCIKVSELQYTLQFLRRFPGRPLFTESRCTLSPAALFDGSLPDRDRDGILELLDELLPFSGPKERVWIENLKGFLNSMSRMKEMMATADMLKDLFPEGMGEGSRPEDIFQGVDLTSAMQMFQMFQSSPGDGQAPDKT